MKFKVIDNTGMVKIFDSYKNAYYFAMALVDKYGLICEKSNVANILDKFTKMHYVLAIKLVLI